MVILFSVFSPACKQTDYDQGVVTVERATLRSTTARVATLSGEVKRGDNVWIVDQHSPWVKVKTMTKKPVEGWLDEKYVVLQKLVNESRKLLREVEQLPPQAIGRLKIDARLRLKPAREDDDNNVIQILRARSTFDILEKQRTPRSAVAGADTDEANDASQSQEPAKFDTWYKVRLPREFVCRVGWLLAASTELAVPPEIQSFESGLRRFAGWQEVGVVQDSESGEVHNYIVFEKQIFGGDPQADFDRVYGVGWDANDHSYYSFFAESNLRGVFPVMRRAAGNEPILVIRLLEKNNREVSVNLRITKNQSGKLHVEKSKPVAVNP